MIKVYQCAKFERNRFSRLGGDPVTNKQTNIWLFLPFSKVTCSSDAILTYLQQFKVITIESWEIWLYYGNKMALVLCLYLKCNSSYGQKYVFLTLTLTLT